jgi:hypothetical protein
MEYNSIWSFKKEILKNLGNSVAPTPPTTSQYCFRGNFSHTDSIHNDPNKNFVSYIDANGFSQTINGIYNDYGTTNASGEYVTTFIAQSITGFMGVTQIICT